MESDKIKNFPSVMWKNADESKLPIWSNRCKKPFTVESRYF